MFHNIPLVFLFYSYEAIPKQIFYTDNVVQTDIGLSHQKNYYQEWNMCLLTEWESRIEKYLARGHDVKTERSEVRYPMNKSQIS